jgi:3-oxoacyl-[acyl-carrier-protein] synthase-3
MNGRTVFKNACEKMPQAVLYGLQQLGLSISNIDYLIPHQANDRISQMVGRALRLPGEKVIRNIQRYGNTTAASIPIALAEAVQNGLIKKGHLLALTRVRFWLYLGFSFYQMVKKIFKKIKISIYN